VALIGPMVLCEENRLLRGSSRRLEDVFVEMLGFPDLSEMNVNKNPKPRPEKENPSEDEEADAETFDFEELLDLLEVGEEEKIRGNEREEKEREVEREEKSRDSVKAAEEAGVDEEGLEEVIQLITPESKIAFVLENEDTSQNPYSSMTTSTSASNGMKIPGTGMPDVKEKPTTKRPNHELPSLKPPTLMPSNPGLQQQRPVIISARRPSGILPGGQTTTTTVTTDVITIDLKTITDPHTSLSSSGSKSKSASGSKSKSKSASGSKSKSESKSESKSKSASTSSSDSSSDSSTDSSHGSHSDSSSDSSHGSQ